MSSLNQDMLRDLYSSGLSMADIAKQQGISVHKVVYWMEKYGIQRRSWSDATYIKRNPHGNPFEIIHLDSIEKIELFSLGIGLFLGEGNKKNNYQIRFANSDSQIIKLFLSFIRKICNVEKSKIRASINIFDDRIYSKALDYWIKITGIQKENFYKPTIRPRRQGTYKNKSKYGTITILVSNKKLLDQIKTWCGSSLKKYAEVAQW